ncbi:DUF1878 family protein [Lentibacillus amyloliquefaciens]|uniref:DUF1878 domain-containing protein n=1 Tax=Lentibacillus amyloliquefaciens TaxID=1472767 RepID=A0A0U4E731_9BACI|nr:DUF1878 family protein [Lentibacillus amyloliquefaciens]ALX48705.1 hypothetical protein AOX59_08810 [Lentibacillus amyloliquefaciens]
MNNGQNETINFHLQLLAKTIDLNQFPFTKMIIEQNITKSEYENLFYMLDELELQYQKQKEEGFLNFSSLLVQFAGMLNERFDPNTLVYALKKEGYYPSLMGEFISILEK